MMESTFKGAAEISGDTAINKMGKYSYRNIKNIQKKLGS